MDFSKGVRGMCVHIEFLHSPTIKSCYVHRNFILKCRRFNVLDCFLEFAIVLELDGIDEFLEIVLSILRVFSS